MEKVYNEVYPEEASESGSILLFGGAAKELHAESSKWELRQEHHHAPTYSSKQHLWSRIAKVSLEKHHVKMHAACHDGYTSMYDYVRKPSVKKQLSELDAEFFLSTEHPRGGELRRLLEAGAASNRAQAAKRARSAGGDLVAQAAGDGSATPGGATKRIRVADVYDIVRSGGYRHALALQAHAEVLSQQGDVSLARFCTSHGTVRLQEHLKAAWAVIDAPKSLVPTPTRLEKLKDCAMHHQCVCGGIWKAGAAFVLENNRENVARFGRDVCRALALGAKRGVNVAVVGEPGCGKSMILQPLELIFCTMPPPEDGSTFPLAGIVNVDVILWQDFEYSSRTVNYMDLLRVLVGERVGVRIPGEKNVSVNNKAPMFYSALEKIAPHKSMSHAAYTRKSLAMDERFVLREWSRPLPMARRHADFPHCAPCFASFMLDNDAEFHRAASQGVE